MRLKKILLWILEKIIIPGIVITIISLYITNALTPKTDINVACEGISDANNPELKSIGINKYLSLNFTNKAKFAGEDFNIILNNVSYNYIKTFYGVGYTGNFLCNPIENKYNLAYFKCDYIPPKSSIELRLLPSFDNFEIVYWSKTTPEKKININCS